MNSLKMTFIFLAFFSFSCKAQKKAVTPDGIVNAFPLGVCIPHIDSSVNGIIFSDPNSFVKKFGSVHFAPDAQTDCIYFSNKTGTEFMSLHHENGGDSSAYDIISVANTANSNKKAVKIKDKQFISSNGVHLGMSANDLFKKFNRSCFSSATNGGRTTYRYHDDRQTYLAEYVFLNSALVSYTIGYDHS